MSVPQGPVMSELKRVAVRGKVKTLKIPISFLLGCSSWGTVSVGCQVKYKLLVFIIVIIIISPQNEIIWQHLLVIGARNCPCPVSRKNLLLF